MSISRRVDLSNVLAGGPRTASDRERTCTRGGSSARGPRTVPLCGAGSVERRCERLARDAQKPAEAGRRVARATAASRKWARVQRVTIEGSDHGEHTASRRTLDGDGRARDVQFARSAGATRPIVLEKMQQYCTGRWMKGPGHRGRGVRRWCKSAPPGEYQLARQPGRLASNEST